MTALIVTSGYGNGILAGTIKDVVTRGYSIGTTVQIWTPTTDNSNTWSATTDDSGTWTPTTDDTGTWT